MDTANQDIYFQKLEEFVYDDDKVITVSSVASDLNVSVKDARELILKYVEDNRQLKPGELAVTYILTGILKDSEKKGVCIVKESNLESKRLLFEKKLRSEVLYSVQKNKDIDFNVISLSGEKPKEKPLLGCIVSKNCVKRVLKIRKLPSPTKAGKKSFFTKTASTTSSEKPTEAAKNEAKPTKSNGIASMFNNVAIKTTNSTTKIANGKSSGAGLSGFLVKGAPLPKIVPLEKPEPKKIEAVKDMGEAMDVDVEQRQETSKPRPEKKTKKRQQNDKSSSDRPTKKRKRIVERNESDSDDIFGNDELDIEDIIEKSDEEIDKEDVKPPPGPKNKRRRAVDKTYEDEEGFIVTKTEYVYETPSEDEAEEPPTKKPEPPKPVVTQKKDTSNSENDTPPLGKGPSKKGKGKKAPSGNQPTLMNFFKKK